MPVPNTNTITNTTRADYRNWLTSTARIKNGQT